ncbi:hypothetical protein FGG78_14895 [Thioclava sp. BHET1]|nr:hypothetical protein FGG78_14895 [Thioclava sp. BHET1]
MILPATAAFVSHHSLPVTSTRSARAQARSERLRDVLGPDPRATLTCLIDLGLSDAEIARYFRLSKDRVRRLTAGLRHTLREGYAVI